MIIAGFILASISVWVAGMFLLGTYVTPYLRVKKNWDRDECSFGLFLWPVMIFLYPGHLLITLAVDLFNKVMMNNIMVRSDRKIKELQDKESGETERRMRKAMEAEEAKRQTEALEKARIKDAKFVPFRGLPAPDKHCNACGSDPLHWRKDMLAELERVSEEETVSKKKSLGTLLKS